MQLLFRGAKGFRWPGLVCAGVLALPGVSFSWDGAVSGVITQIDVTDGANAGFRVYLPIAMCGNTNGWAYLNSTDSNYSAYAAALLTAKSQGTTVYIYSNRDGNGNCHIGYISIV
jgi:hypothetical protein